MVCKIQVYLTSMRDSFGTPGTPSSSELSLLSLAADLDELTKSSNRASSSLPSSVLVMQHFRNLLIMLSLVMKPQDSTVHWTTCCLEGAFILPALYSFCPFIIHSYHKFLVLCLKGQLTATSRGCRIKIMPPGIMTLSTFHWLTADLTR